MLMRPFESALPLLMVGVALTTFFSISSVSAEVQQATQVNNIWDGVYSEDQANRGGNAYEESCSSCHRSNLGGYNGALKGPRFMERWREDSLESLFTNIRKTMPRDKAGSLTVATYIDIVAYILQQNAFPVGTAELKSEDLNKIQVVGRSGAEPLPAGALAQTYGCVTAGPNNSWILSRATTLARTRNPDKSSDEDLKRAESAPTGVQTYRLIDAAFYHPENHTDHKVEAKGFLIKEPSEGLSLTSLTMISATCQ